MYDELTMACLEELDPTFLVKFHRMVKELKSLQKRKAVLNRRQRARWEGKFVRKWVDDKNWIRHELTDFGRRELEEYSIDSYEQLKDIPKERRWSFENPVISYTPDECFCMICHSHNICSTAQAGMCPRWATCFKHADFLMLHDNHLIR